MREAIKDFWVALKVAITTPLPDFTKQFDEEVLASDRRAQRLGYGIVVAVLLGFGGWAVIAPLESAAIGMGTVQVEGDSKPVQHYEGGIVSEILVESGDYVEQDQALLRLNSAQFEAERRIVQARLWATQAAIDRLTAERDGASLVLFRSTLTSVANENVQMAMASERALFAARRADRLAETAVLEQKIAQLEERAGGGASRGRGTGKGGCVSHIGNFRAERAAD